MAKLSVLMESNEIDNDKLQDLLKEIKSLQSKRSSLKIKHLEFEE